MSKKSKENLLLPWQLVWSPLRVFIALLRDYDQVLVIILTRDSIGGPVHWCPFRVRDTGHTELNLLSSLFEKRKKKKKEHLLLFL